MILITGTTGFVGKNFVSRSQIKDEFRCVVRNGKHYNFEYTFTVDGIHSLTDWNGAFNDVKAIIHLAGLAHSDKYLECDYHAINVAGTLKLAQEAAKSGVKRFIFVSSIGVNGTVTCEIPFSNTDTPQPNNPYAESKCQAELGLRQIATETGMELVIVRPTLVYGVNAPGNFGQLTKLVSKTPLLPFGLACNKRNFISVDNLVDLLITCVKHPAAAGNVFLASESESVSTEEFTTAIAKGLGKRVIQLPIPPKFIKMILKLVGKSSMYSQLFENLEVDSSNLKQILDWTSPYTMEESMAFLKDTKK